MMVFASVTCIGITGHFHFNNKKMGYIEYISANWGPFQTSSDSIAAGAHSSMINAMAWSQF